MCAVPLRHFLLVLRATVLAIAAALLLGSAAPDGSAIPRKTGKASTPRCGGEARRLRPGHVGFSFNCGETQDVTSFVLQANRTLHSVYDPSFAFSCQRSTARSFDCGDIHSGAGPEGSGVASISGPLCGHGTDVVLRVTPTINFDTRSLAAFTLKGPC